MNIYRKTRAYIREQAYYIGFFLESDIFLSNEQRFKKIQWLQLGKYKSGWFADPFFLSVNDNFIELLVEEWEYSKHKGRLCKLLIEHRSSTFVLKEVIPILELETHLSFPITIEDDGKLYVYPENYESGSLKIYEYDYASQKLINPIQIINAPLLDTQIVKLGNNYYAMGVNFKNGTHEDTKKLSIYKSDSLLGNYKLTQEITNNKREERGAGLIYMHNDKLIRPAQCCEGDYGLSVINYELNFDNGLFSEHEINRLLPSYNKRFGAGMHTFNKMNGVCVIDGRDFRRYPFANFLKLLSSIL